MRDLLDDHARLARTGAGEDEERTVAMLDGSALLGIEAVHRNHLRAEHCAVLPGGVKFPDDAANVRA
ncbi:hypothetical protein GCM10008101_22850 [Lysobacter xinjiangensis]|uniref:Uncharacterized protein n=1 Tax=Cognatilysobacter xinjiangensis TaxID=546892 RepID=A0ABQ3C4Q7_9GAMM|nr:hypothetical protein GCM10008101_22850 [Lysobacter xinjiangensis]